MEQFELKDGHRIFSSLIYFNSPVHAPGYGFTNFVIGFATACSLDEAERRIVAKYQEYGNGVDMVQTKLAQQQDVNRYCFPENIAGLSLATKNSLPPHNQICPQV